MSVDGPRFVARECHGYTLTGAATHRGGAALPGMTVTVHDAAYCYRVVALWRTERQLPRTHPMTRLDRFALARARARALTYYLNARESVRDLVAAQ